MQWKEKQTDNAISDVCPPQPEMERLWGFSGKDLVKRLTELKGCRSSTLEEILHLGPHGKYLSFGDALTRV